MVNFNTYFPDQSTMIFTWTPITFGKTTSRYLKIFLADTLNATSYYWPDIHLCACNDIRKCVFDSPLARWETGNNINL